MPSALAMKLLGGLAGLLMVLGLVLGLKHYKALASERGDKLAAICSETRAASGNPKLKCGDVPKQIQFMGEAIGTLTQALHKQNDAVAAMGAETARQQQNAAQASADARQRAKQPQKVSDSLTASARAPERQSAPCKPSKALEGAWQ